MRQKKQRLEPGDFAQLLNCDPSPFLQNRIKKAALSYSEISSEERDELIRRCMVTLLDPFLVFSGKHRLEQWEKGWKQNLNAYARENTSSAVIPGYFGKYPIVRLNQRWIRAESKEFEYRMLGIILDWIFDRYLRKAEAVYEFGCGTGHNLIRLREINPHAELWGLDWATSSQQLVRAYAKKNKDARLHAHRFDYFYPDKKFHLHPNGVVYTVASLEQIGDKHAAFLKYLLKEKPSLCIHIEPVAELLTPDTSLLDYLSVEYFKKRKYLSGFLTRLQVLEREGRIKIHHAERTNIGSFFIEGYSVIVWSPVA